MESKLRTMPSKRSSVVHQPRALQAGLLHLPCKRPKTTLPQPHPEEHASNFFTIDLRIKRVFSPNLQNRSSLSSREPIGDRERLITVNGTRSNEDTGVGNTHVECDEGWRCNGKSEELVHSTPPDVDILTGGFVSASSSGCPRSSYGGVLGNTCVKSDCRFDSVARTGSVLKPCSKRKLFKAPGSIAYKRLLPFLMDNDNYKLQDDPNSKSENNLVKKVNNESDLRNHVKGSFFLDSDTCVKNAIFASGLSCKSTKLNLPPPDNGDASNFQNGGGLNNSQTTIKEDSGLKKDNADCASSLDERLTEQSKNPGIDTLDGGSIFVSEVDNLMSHVSEDITRDGHFNEELKMSSLNSNIVDRPLNEERRDGKLGSSTVGENHCSIATESDKKTGACVRNKMVRNPLVQLKSKYSQVSFSYRRMRPFLEDLFKDIPENCDSGNIDCSVPEKELPTMNLQPPCSNSHNSRDKSEGLVSCNIPVDGNSYTPSVHVLTSKKETDCETDEVLLPAGVDDKLLSSPKLTLHTEQEMLDECNLKTDPQLPGATFLNDQAVPPLYPAASYETLIGEEFRMTSEQSPITSEDCTSLKDRVSDGANIDERNSLAPHSSSVGGILPGIHINHRKGILKRNTRGCKGICNCLNCSSFRLHAERAFEFSRNQLQDAEEVASDLMKELSYLRGVLEKYSDGAKGDAEYHNSNKVKEACRKASEAELTAKDRLQQMNYELNIHCRITCSQRPNVRFSGEVEKLDIEDGK